MSTDGDPMMIRGAVRRLIRPRPPKEDAAKQGPRENLSYLMALAGTVASGGALTAGLMFAAGYLSSRRQSDVLGLLNSASPQEYVRVGGVFLIDSIQTGIEAAGALLLSDLGSTLITAAVLVIAAVTIALIYIAQSRWPRIVDYSVGAIAILAAILMLRWLPIYLAPLDGRLTNLLIQSYDADFAETGCEASNLECIDGPVAADGTTPHRRDLAVAALYKDLHEPDPTTHLREHYVRRLAAAVLTALILVSLLAVGSGFPGLSRRAILTTGISAWAVIAAIVWCTLPALHGVIGVDRMYPCAFIFPREAEATVTGLAERKARILSPLAIESERILAYIGQSNEYSLIFVPIADIERIQVVPCDYPNILAVVK